jgi:hypothetical protein
MGPRKAYKDKLDNVVSPIACVSMNHQNQLEQMANGACSLQGSAQAWALARSDSSSGSGAMRGEG